MKSKLHPLKKLVGKLGNELLGILVGTVDIVTTGDDAGELEGPVIGFDNELSTSLCSSVGVRRLKNVLFSHGLGVEVLALTVHLIRRHMDETADGFTTLGRFKKDVSAINVGLREGEGVTERVVDVRLSGKVHHCINLLLLEDVVDKIRTGNVSLNELEIWQVCNLGKIF